MGTKIEVLVFGPDAYADCAFGIVQFHWPKRLLHSQKSGLAGIIRQSNWVYFKSEIDFRFEEHEGYFIERDEWIFNPLKTERRLIYFPVNWIHAHLHQIFIGFGKMVTAKKSGIGR